MALTSKIILQKSYIRARWRNGLGYTDQIAIFPEDADLKTGNFIWRFSSARIEQASAFSLFPEHDRVLVIIKGEGVGLSHTFEPDAEEYVEVLPFSPYEFPGDIPSRCELLSGGVTDLSLFVRKGEGEPLVEVIDVKSSGPLSWQPQGRTNFLFAAQGNVKIGASLLTEGDTLRLEGVCENPLEVFAKSPAAKIITISL